MRLGMPILYEYDKILDNFILAKKLNLDFIELNLNFSYCRKAIENNLILDLVNKYKIDTTLHFYDEADFGLYDEVVDGYIKLLDKYITLGGNYIKQVNFHNQVGPIVTISGVKNYINEKEFDDYSKRLISNFTKARDILNKYNISLVIENTYVAGYMEMTYKILQDNDFKFCYDIGHDFVDNLNLEKINNKLNLKFNEFHIHDGINSKCHLALGEGIIDIKKFKDMAIKNDAYVVVEVKKSIDLIKSIPYFRNI